MLFMTRLLPFKIHQHTLMEVKLEALARVWAWEMHFPLLLWRTAMSKKATRRGWGEGLVSARPPMSPSIGRG